MAGTDDLTVHILDQNANLRSTQSFRNIDLSAWRPFDVIQFIYQKGQKVSTPGTTTIWKMGRCVIVPGDPTPRAGRPLTEGAMLSDAVNGINSGDQVILTEENL